MRTVQSKSKKQLTKEQEVCYTDIAVKQEVTTEEKKLKKVVDKLEEV